MQISSQSGKLSAHSLSVLLTQPDVNTLQKEQSIPRLKKTGMTQGFHFQLDTVRHNDPKRPKCPPQFVKMHVPSLKVLAHMVAES